MKIGQTIIFLYFTFSHFTDGDGKKQGPVNKDEQEIRGIKCKCPDGSWGTYYPFVKICPKGTSCAVSTLVGVCCH